MATRREDDWKRACVTFEKIVLKIDATISFATRSLHEGIRLDKPVASRGPRGGAGQQDDGLLGVREVTGGRWRQAEDGETTTDLGEGDRGPRSGRPLPSQGGSGSPAKR